MYAIVKTGGKQYRVQEGQWLLVERLPAAEGERIALEPLLYVSDSEMVDGAEIGRVSVTATVLDHERGPKLRVVKFKPKRGYKRRNGHRQELTRILITDIALASDGGSAERAVPAPAEPQAAAPVPVADVPAPVGFAVAQDTTGEVTDGA